MTTFNYIDRDFKMHIAARKPCALLCHPVKYNGPYALIRVDAVQRSDKLVAIVVNVSSFSLVAEFSAENASYAATLNAVASAESFLQSATKEAA